MGWIQLVVAIAGLAREFLKYKSEQSKTAKEKAKVVNNLRVGMRHARKKKDTSALEASFADVGIDLGIKQPVPNEASETGRSLDA